MSTPEQKELDKKLAASEEMRQFFRALAISQSNAIARVFEKPDDADAIIQQAKDEVRRIHDGEEKLLQPPPKCNTNEVWDEKQQRCVLI